MAWPYEPIDATGASREQIEQRPVACKLADEERRVRREKLRLEFLPGVLEIEEIEGGCVYWFERSEALLSKIADFALFESDCCDFLDFGIGLNAGGDRISLRISGPHGPGPFLT